MGNALDYLGHLVTLYPAWSHAIIAVGILLQGEITILLSMYLIANGDLTWYGFFGSTIPALFIGESFIYFFGRTIRNTRFGWRLYRKIKANRKTQAYLYYIRENLMKLVMVSKFLIGTNLILVLLIGWLRTKFGTFLKAYTAGLLLWFTSMTVVAYSLMSGVRELHSSKSLREVEYAVLGVIIIVFIGEYFLRKQIHHRTLGAINPEEIKKVLDSEPDFEAKTKNPTT